MTDCNFIVYLFVYLFLRYNVTLEEVEITILTIAHTHSEKFGFPSNVLKESCLIYYL